MYKRQPEMASSDVPTTFKVNVKLVVVRVVARDSQGHAIGNLQQQDFQVFDNGKPQTITQFSVEKAGSRVTIEPSGSISENSPSSPNNSDNPTPNAVSYTHLGSPTFPAPTTRQRLPSSFKNIGNKLLIFSRPDLSCNYA